MIIISGEISALQSKIPNAPLTTAVRCLLGLRLENKEGDITNYEKTNLERCNCT